MAQANAPRWTPSTSTRGDIVRWSRTIIPTMRDAPAEATTPSHRLLLRAGYIRQVAAGVYDYLPLAWRTLTKVSRIVREEMNAAGGTEMLMPALAPMELFEETGRAEDYGDDLFRLEDRHGRPTALGPTHEEVITAFLRDAVTSYRQLPLILYQIQSKFRDEPRPRAGLLRCREFIMKDAYSFHHAVDGPGGLNEAYDAMYRAYTNVFSRCGLDFTAVEAESGPIGGSASHEFMVNCETGEDTILRCPVSGYAANVEKCEIGERPWSFDGAAGAPLARIHTPDLPGIDAVAAFLRVTPADMLKTVVLEPGAGADGGGVSWVLAVVRGDHEVNEGKVRDAVGFKVALADEKRARAAGFAIGYVSPRAAPSAGASTIVVVDPDAAQGDRSWATGADERDHHVTGFHWRRDMGESLGDPRYVKVADIRNARVGDPSPRAPGAALVAQRGIETGHIFKLGTKYSDAMGFAVMDESQSRRSVIMGCYGIGVSRTMAACVEMSHDENGIVWPAAIAPYHAEIVLMKPADPEHAALAARLAEELAGAGLDVLIDDRDERPGVKFKDADLVGIPLRITIGEKALAAGGVELKARTDSGKGEVVPLTQVRERCLAILAP
ncbi:MAG TPA: proline--tRNA ligase [Phycisphaerales bacterium]|nr:proline--tRNA ligase [Phycisphaerales bacterium]